MLKSIMAQDYPTIKGFCNHYKFAHLLINDDFTIVEANKVACRLFNIDLDNIRGRSLIHFCRQNGVDCPIAKASNIPPIVQNTYHHALKVECTWSLIELITKTSESKWVLLGKMLNQPLFEKHTHLNAQFLDHIPMPIYCKNNQGIYIKSNHAATNLANQTIIGKTDFELPWHHQAAFLQESDQRALEGETITSLQTIQDHSGQIKQFRTTKHPIYDLDGRVVSVMGISLECPLTNEQDHIKTIDNPLEGVCFNQKELEYINWMIKGKTAEEIALILNKSPRTVETHLTKIRRKTASQGQFQMGYMLAKYFTAAGIANYG